MRLTQELLYRTRDVDLRLAQVDVPQLDLWLVGWPQNQLEGVFCQTQFKKNQPSKTSVRKQRQTARPWCLVDRGTPLLSRADSSSSSSSRPGIRTRRNLWRFTVALQLRPAAHHTHTTCPYSTLHHAAAPKSSRNAAHGTRQNPRIRIRQLRNTYCMNLTLIYIYVCVCVTVVFTTKSLQYPTM
jgi:hypothetical protein